MASSTIITVITGITITIAIAVNSIDIITTITRMVTFVCIIIATITLIVIFIRSFAIMTISE